MLGLAIAGNKDAIKLFKLQAIAVALLFNHIATMLDLTTIVGGGGGTQHDATFAAWFLEQVEFYTRQHLTKEHADRVQFFIARDQDNAGALGAALNALRKTGGK